ncbi:SDR family NAD(P)-dependent oxidoreductase [Lentibacillus salicampi]|uniref:SDR family NAD(P)-dependent oxidoreductase n=1 Tax=Lentibacillus salicampi TaxID=175306 RepID=UPI0014301053|nr:SDR family NAD(P)-dependent oxidoreductase [Lentibacillus salicampi]
MRLKGKNAIITGGARGIGKGIAERFVEEGAHVTIIDVRKADMLNQKIYKDYPENIAIQECNLSNIKQTKAVLDAIWDKQGQIDIVINNAGIATREPFVEIAEETWDQVMSVNLKAMFIVGQHVSKKMMETGIAGSIVNMGSKNGLAAGAQLTHYNVSKGGINSLTQTMGTELASSQIRVNSVAPGFIDTPLDQVLKDRDSNLELTQRTPMKRLGTIKEVANTVLFLASDEASYITGTTIVVDGGHLANAGDL